MELETKKEMRKRILEQRDKIELPDKEKFDKRIFFNVINSEFYRRAEVIFIFVSFRSEVDTIKIINQAIRDGKTVCVPKIRSKETGMEAFRINSLDELKQGYFGILEPVEGCPKIEADKIDLILTPGAAFDLEGGRIGYGGGFYDRYFANMKKRVNKIALAYHLQIVDKIPMDETDMRVEGIITDENIIIVKQ